MNTIKLFMKNISSDSIENIWIGDLIETIDNTIVVRKNIKFS